MSQIDLDLQWAITLKELAPSPYFSIINVHLVEMLSYFFCQYRAVPL